MQTGTGYLTQQSNIHSLLGTVKCTDQMSINICQTSFNVIEVKFSEHATSINSPPATNNAIDNAPTEIGAYRHGKDVWLKSNKLLFTYDLAPVQCFLSRGLLLFDRLLFHLI